MARILILARSAFSRNRDRHERRNATLSFNTGDHCLLRFLRARNGSVPKAAEMFVATARWRRSFGATLNVLGRSPEAASSFSAGDLLPLLHPLTRIPGGLYPGGWCGKGRDHNPVFYERLGGLDFRGLSKFLEPNDVRLFSVWRMERCSEIMVMASHAGFASRRFTLVLDLRGVKLRDFLRRKLLNLVRMIGKIGDSYYPERLCRTLVVNAPYVFDKAWNGVIRHFFEKDTQEKVKVARSGASSLELLHRFIAPEQLPACFPGGELALNGDPECASRINPGGKVPADPKAWRRSVNETPSERERRLNGEEAFFPDPHAELAETTLHPVYWDSLPIDRLNSLERRSSIIEVVGAKVATAGAKMLAEGVVERQNLVQ